MTAGTVPVLAWSMQSNNRRIWFIYCPTEPVQVVVRIEQQPMISVTAHSIDHLAHTFALQWTERAERDGYRLRPGMLVHEVAYDTVFRLYSKVTDSDYSPQLTALVDVLLDDMRRNGESRPWTT